MLRWIGIFELPAAGYCLVMECRACEAEKPNICSSQQGICDLTSSFSGVKTCVVGMTDSSISQNRERSSSAGSD